MKRTITVLALLLPIVGFASLAFAAAASSPSQDPMSTLAQLYEYMRTGKGTAAAGAALTLIVWGLRHYALGSWIPWFKTTVGGYVLGFGVPFLSYFATGLLSGNPFTLSMVINAVGAGWVAGCVWEHIQDAIAPKTSTPAGATPPSSSTPPPIPSSLKRTLLAALCVLLVVDLGAGCAAFKKDAAIVEHAAVVDCTKGNLGDLLPIAGVLLGLVSGGALDIAALETAAIHMGGDVGGCFLAHLHDQINASGTGTGSAVGFIIRRPLMKHADYRRATGATATYHTAHAEY